MRILDVSAITDSKQFFPKQGTLQFLQDAYKEQLNNLCLALLGSIAYSPTTAYVLFGCVNSGSGSNYVISAGAIFYNGEVFSVPAVSLTASGNVPVANIVTAQYTVNADPVTYSDSTTGNIHNIRTISIGLGTSGSGISDYSAFVVPGVSSEPTGEIKTIYAGSGFTSNFDGTGLGTTKPWIGWALMNGNNGTVNMAGRSLIGVGTGTDSNSNTQTFAAVAQGGEFTHTLTLQEINHRHVAYGIETNRDTANNGTALNSSNRENHEYTDYLVGGQNGTDSGAVPNPTGHNNLPPYLAVYFVQKIA